MKTKSRHIWFLLTAFLLTTMLVACIDEETTDDGRVTMPVRLTIPAAGVTRTPGDPGLAGGINLPRYAYIFVVIGYSPSGTEDASTTYTCYYRDITLDDNWSELQTWNSTEPQTSGDAYYEYRGSITLTLPAHRTVGRVYAAVSYQPIAFTPPTTDPDDYHITSSVTEDAIKNWQVDFTKTGGTAFSSIDLRDVFSTPADYTIGGNYYGTINNISERVPNLDLHLYHVASCVDILWNVATDKQATVRLTDMQLKNLKYKDCYLFRPTMNTEDEASPTTRTTFDGPAFDVGNQWYGRHSFYVIPYRCTSDNKIPVTVALWQNDDTHSSAVTPLTRIFEIDGSLLGSGTIFVPWLRGQLMITDLLY